MNRLKNSINMINNFDPPKLVSILMRILTKLHLKVKKQKKKKTKTKKSKKKKNHIRQHHSPKKKKENSQACLGSVKQIWNIYWMLVDISLNRSLTSTSMIFWFWKQSWKKSDLMLCIPSLFVMFGKKRVLLLLTKSKTSTLYPTEWSLLHGEFILFYF